ncbi:MAG: ribonuclease Y [Parcubacteria group bacterium CG08_land_8_20_14_0_20_38_56]|nr:MAG: ribonuclease Y [Parcubacteria group bacterium CG08_land_8_20_14_0_20_38_56]
MVEYILGISLFLVGFGSGYWIRRTIVRRRAGTIEAKIQRMASDAKQRSQQILFSAKEKAVRIIGEAKKEEREHQNRLLELQKRLERREVILDEKLNSLEEKQKSLLEKAEKVKEIKETLESLKEQKIEELQKVAHLSLEEAKKELFLVLERNSEMEIMEKMKKLENESGERLKKRAQEIIALSIQKYAASLASEITTTTVLLPNDEIKGRIIGKEGRNIKTIEKLTGVEVIVDDTPEAVVISGFDPIRRQIAKIALEKLVSDGRIQPARIEEQVEKATREISLQIKEAGERAVYDARIFGVDPKLNLLLGRLNFRTSYGQNVLLHSIEVCHLAGALAAELGGNVGIAKKAGLLHDIGKAVDHEIQGSHVEIGINILKKFGVEEEVITAMKCHHEEYPCETLEAVLVQAADAISGSRPGARKDTLESYLKRLSDLEEIATALPAVEKAYAIQAGRELRVFVKPEEISDLEASKLAREIANKIEEELKYPGEIKVTLIREKRIVEYAK